MKQHQEGVGTEGEMQCLPQGAASTTHVLKFPPETQHGEKAWVKVRAPTCLLVTSLMPTSWHIPWVLLLAAIPFLQEPTQGPGCLRSALLALGMRKRPTQTEWSKLDPKRSPEGQR